MRKLWSSRDGVLWLAILLAALLTAGLSIARYRGYNAGMLDLGNMAQAIASAGRGEPLIYTSADGSFSRLAGHVEIFYFLLAPFYRLWPDPQMLLVFQAALFALGAIPVYRLALRHTNSVFAARCLALIYLLFPTALTSVLFDFHGDTLAMPLLLFMLDALDQRAWYRYAVLVALVLSCKVYLALPVAGIGLYLLIWGGQRRAGALTLASAMIYGTLTFFVIRPLFALPTPVAGQGIAGYIGQYFGRVDELLATLVDRCLSAVVVFGPALLVAWRGWRWLLPGLPVAAAALISTGPGGVYDYRYHHYAIIVPFILMAAISGVELRMKNVEWRNKSGSQLLHSSFPIRHSRRRGRSWRGDLGLTLAITLIFTTLLVDTPLNPLFWAGLPGQGRDPSAYGILPRDAVKDDFLLRVPQGAALAASNQIAPHLADRQTLYLLRYPDEADGPRRLPQSLARVDYAIADALFDLYLPIEGGYGGGLDGDREAIGVLLRDRDFGLVGMRDGLLLFQRGAPAERVLTNSLEMLPDDDTATEQSFGTQVALVRHSIAQTGPRRLRASFTWRLTGDFGQAGRFVAVSRLDGLDNARIVHLPSYTLQPAWEWQPGQLIVETFDIELPPETTPGRYHWQLGWYHSGLPSSYATDMRSLLPGSTEVTVDVVVIR